jgi:hypothetical protein
MKKVLALLCLFMYTSCSVFSEIYEGGVFEEGKYFSGQNRIIDKKTGKGVGGAKITLPKEKYQTKTNKEGYFELDTAINGTSIMSVKKEHYKPFSMTINEKGLNSPLVVGIEKSNSADVTIDTNMHHLGDGSFSDNSANADEFRGETTGPFFTKRFILRNIKTKQPVFLVIGSIIGIDTLMARSMGQNRNPNSYSSPPEVFFNGNKISEIQINGDGQKIKIP